MRHCSSPFQSQKPRSCRSRSILCSYEVPHYPEPHKLQDLPFYAEAKSIVRYLICNSKSHNTPFLLSLLYGVVYRAVVLKLSLYQNHWEGLLKHSWPPSLEFLIQSIWSGGPRTCIFNKFPGYAKYCWSGEHTFRNTD